MALLHLIYIQKTVTNINQLMKTVKVVEDDSQKATRALESALESIGQDLQTLYSDTQTSWQSSASPEDLLKINRALAEATGKAVAASTEMKEPVKTPTLPTSSCPPAPRWKPSARPQAW